MPTDGFGLRKTPSLQHAVVLIGETVESTVQNIRKLKSRHIDFTLDLPRQLIAAVLGGQSIDWAYGQIEAHPDGIPKRMAGEIIDCMQEYFATTPVKWFRRYRPVLYSVGRDYAIPVSPLGVLNDGRKTRLVCAQLWKNETLTAEQFNIYGTILEHAIFSTDPDIDELEWLELSRPPEAKHRDLRVRDRSAYDIVPHDELADILSRLVQAVEIYDRDPEPPRKPKDDGKQGDLFKAPKA